MENNLNKRLKRINIINHQILDELLTPEKLTKYQENQILKLKQEKYKERANYFEELKRLTDDEFKKIKYDKSIKDCKDTECRIYYLNQSKKR